MSEASTLESNVRSYCRRFRGVIRSAHGSTITTEDGRSYTDFLMGAGSLNYGHNHPELIAEISAYLTSGGPLHTLDFRSTAKERFIEAFSTNILEPRGMSYKLQFTGPTGTNAVEAAMKLARKVTGRRSIVAFTGAFHGMTAGSLAASAKTCPTHLSRADIVRMPYDGFFGPDVDTMNHIEAMFESPGSGLEPPAAFIVETVQGDGGLNTLSAAWCQRLSRLAKRLGSLFIIDDIQAGCGRTGSFFSFDSLGVEPDLVCLSKSLSASGLPMALLLVAPSLDKWEPGEHSGTFRGNCLAFVTAAVATQWWASSDIQAEAMRRAGTLTARLDAMVSAFPHVVRRKGRGLFQGLEMTADAADRVADAAYTRGLVIETAGPRDEIVKVMPALNIEDGELSRGLDILQEAVAECLKPNAILATG